LSERSRGSEPEHNGELASTGQGVSERYGSTATATPLITIRFREKAMIEYKNNPNNNIIEIIIEGKITEEDFDQVVAQLKVDIAKHGKLRILEELRHFEGIDPQALWKDIRFGFAHLNDFTHAALVADTKWLRTLAEAFNSVLSVKVKAFEPSQIDEARNWLSNT
jgi:SpoIIAA-like